MSISFRIAVLVCLLFLSLSDTLRAQHLPRRGGVAHLVNWPESAVRSGQLSAEEARQLPGSAILPSVDTFSLGYEYTIAGDLPYMLFSVDWVAGATAIYDGRRVPFRRVSSGVRLTEIELHAEVFVRGVRSADLLVILDDVQLGAYPDIYKFEATGLDWSNVFADTPAHETRAIFASGFELRNLTITRAVFSMFEDEAAAPAVRPQRRAEENRRAPVRTTVYAPRVHVGIGWRIGQWPVGGSRGSSTPGEPREGSVGRDQGRAGDEKDDSSSETSRSSIRDIIASRYEGEEEEDSKSLLPAALIGAAAVGAIAFAGGTVGYYGIERAPIGLSSGFVLPQGGVLLQVGVNDAVLGADGVHLMVAKVTGFYDLFRLPVQPLMSAGVLGTGAGGDIVLSPTFSLGLAGRFGPAILTAGYDVLLGDIEIGIAITFRRLASTR